MSLMFTRFLRSLNLPVLYKKMHPGRIHKLDLSAVSQWIVSTMVGLIRHNERMNLNLLGPPGRKRQYLEIPGEVRQDARNLPSAGKLWSVGVETQRFHQEADLALHEPHLQVQRVTMASELHDITFCGYKCRERIKKRKWEPLIPESSKLTDEDVQKFVEIMQPITIQAMFSKTGILDMVQSLQYLATLKPSLVVPPILEKYNFLNQ
jgi:Proteasome-substrate-size regulator, mid region